MLLEQLPGDSEPQGCDEETDPTCDPTTFVVRLGLNFIRDEFEQRTWRAFEGIAWDHRPAAEVAAELGLSLGAVYVANSRVMKRLREELVGLI